MIEGCGDLSRPSPLGCAKINSRAEGGPPVDLGSSWRFLFSNRLSVPKDGFSHTRFAISPQIPRAICAAPAAVRMGVVRPRLTRRIVSRRSKTGRSSAHTASTTKRSASSYRRRALAIRPPRIPVARRFHSGGRDEWRGPQSSSATQARLAPDTARTTKLTSPTVTSGFWSATSPNPRATPATITRKVVIRSTQSTTGWFALQIRERSRGRLAAGTKSPTNAKVRIKNPKPLSRT